MTSVTSLLSALDEGYTRDPNNRVWNSATKLRQMNQALRQLSADLGRSDTYSDETYTVASEAGTGEYALPTDFVSVQLVRYNGQYLHTTTLKQIRLQYSTDVQGTPDRYYINENKLGLRAIPVSAGATIELTYRKGLATLTSSGNSPLPESCDDALLLYTAYKLMSPVYRDRALAMLQDYQMALSVLRSQFLFNDENMIMSIGAGRPNVRENALGYDE